MSPGPAPSPAHLGKAGCSCPVPPAATAGHPHRKAHPWTADHTRAPPLPAPAAWHDPLPGGRVKDALRRRLRRPGSRPVLDPPARSQTTAAIRDREQTQPRPNRTPHGPAMPRPNHLASSPDTGKAVRVRHGVAVRDRRIVEQLRPAAASAGRSCPSSYAITGRRRYVCRDDVGGVPVQPPLVRTQETRPIDALGDGQVDRPGGPRRERESFGVGEGGLDRREGGGPAGLRRVPGLPRFGWVCVLRGELAWLVDAGMPRDHVGL